MTSILTEGGKSKPHLPSCFPNRSPVPGIPSTAKTNQTHSSTPRIDHCLQRPLCSPRRAHSTHNMHLGSDCIRSHGAQCCHTITTATIPVATDPAGSLSATCRETAECRFLWDTHFLRLVSFCFNDARLTIFISPFGTRPRRSLVRLLPRCLR